MAAAQAALMVPRKLQQTAGATVQTVPGSTCFDIIKVEINRMNDALECSSTAPSHRSAALSPAHHALQRRHPQVGQSKHTAGAREYVAKAGTRLPTTAAAGAAITWLHCSCYDVLLQARRVETVVPTTLGATLPFEPRHRANACAPGGKCLCSALHVLQSVRDRCSDVVGIIFIKAAYTRLQRRCKAACSNGLLQHALQARDAVNCSESGGLG